MTIEQIARGEALKALIDGKVTVDADAKIVNVYAQCEQPNIGVDNDFIQITNLGVVSAETKPICPTSIYTGNLALSIYCKLNSNRTIKSNRMDKISEQCKNILLNQKSYGGAVFEFDPTNVITPPTPNDTTGYATTRFNVAWHTK